MNVPHPLIDNPDDRPVVLVVDDAPSSLGVLCETLESSGYTVLVACDGDTALRRLALVTPDIILMDAVMPGISGFDACRRIKSDLATKHIPVIFMTGLSDTSHVLEGFACGGVDYVVKPVRAPEVLARLHTHLGNARVARFALDAIDVSGLGVVMLDQQGAISWCSPCAMQLLTQFGIKSDSVTLPKSWWDGGSNMELVSSITEPASASLLVRNMGAAGMDEIMLLLELSSNHMLPAGRLASAALTPRETEVLSWLAKGKTNRDIGDILQLSPRTVSKHLEHIFEKLGVETRSAAAAMASAQENVDPRLTSGKWSH
ncbi:MAG: response regulator transcription factor [Pseudomonadota bacterium]